MNSRDIMDQIVEAIRSTRTGDREIIRDNFHPILKSSERGLAFVDGSNVEIIGAANFSLQLIRTHTVVYRTKKRTYGKSREFFMLASVQCRNGETKYKIQSFPEEFQHLAIDPLDETLRTGKERVAMAKTGDVARSLAEIEAAKAVIEQLEQHDIIVKDGILEPKLSFEARYMSELFDAATQKKIAVCGLAKTCDSLTASGDSVIAAIHGSAPAGMWFYPLPKSWERSDRFAVSLNPKSEYVFRLDMQKDSPHNEILFSLCQNSTDAVFPGYPYGLVEAHKLAKISFTERLQLRTAFQLRAGASWKLIEASLKSMDAHDVLDKI